MSKIGKIVLAIVLLAIVMTAVVLYYHEQGTIPLVSPVSQSQDKVRISSVTVDSTGSRLTVSIQPIKLTDQTITFNNAIVKDAAGIPATSCSNLNPNELSNNQNEEISLTLSSPLSSGTYVVWLTSNHGETFISPPFFVS